MTKFLLLKHYAEIEGVPPIHTWTPEEITQHIRFMGTLSEELQASGEWVGGDGLAERATVVSSDGMSAPVISDGPFAESKEMLAGYMMIDVESEERAIEVAAKLSAAPGPGGRPIAERIEVRQVMDSAPMDQWGL